MPNPPVLHPSPVTVLDKRGADPVAFDADVQAVLNWMVTYWYSDQTAVLAYIRDVLPGAISAGAVAAAAAAGAASAASSAAAALSAQQAAAALASTSVSKTYLTYALAAADLAAIPVGAIVRVLSDETSPGFTSWYQKSGSALVLGLRQDIRATVGTGPRDVPQHAMLGTAAYLDQTWLHAQKPVAFGQAIPVGGYLNTLVDVPGAQLGDFVLASLSVTASAIDVRGYVEQAGQVNVLYQAPASGGYSTPGAHTLYVRVLKRIPE